MRKIDPSNSQVATSQVVGVINTEDGTRISGFDGCRLEQARCGLSDSAQRIERSIRYMMQHLSEPLPVARLAALVNISPSHFFALFKRATGYAPIDFFIRLRMQEACRLFDRTSLNVKEVAAALGYEDPFYFSRTFKSVNHVAPSEYRVLPEEQRDPVREAGIPGVRLRFSRALADSRHGSWMPLNGTAVMATTGRSSAIPMPRMPGNENQARRILHDRESPAHSLKPNQCQVQARYAAEV